MKTLTIKIIDDKNFKFIVQLLSKFNFVVEIKSSDLDVSDNNILYTKDKNEKKQKYDFSDIAGKLQWEGNALSEQKKIRNEWQ